MYLQTTMMYALVVYISWEFVNRVLMIKDTAVVQYAYESVNSVQWHEDS